MIFLNMKISENNKDCQQMTITKKKKMCHWLCVATEAGQWDIPVCGATWTTAWVTSPSASALVISSWTVSVLLLSVFSGLLVISLTLPDVFLSCSRACNHVSLLLLIVVTFYIVTLRWAQGDSSIILSAPVDRVIQGYGCKYVKYSYTLAFSKTDAQKS